MFDSEVVKGVRDLVSRQREGWRDFPALRIVAMYSMPEGEMQAWQSLLMRGFEKFLQNCRPDEPELCGNSTIFRGARSLIDEFTDPYLCCVGRSRGLTPAVFLTREWEERRHPNVDFRSGQILGLRYLYYLSSLILA